MRSHLLAGTLALAAMAAAPAAEPAKPARSQPKQADNSTERVCEDIAMIGSRLTRKRFCGTRAEWADKQLQDKQEIERIQRGPCVSKGGCP
jgi:hypothetical protein